MELRRWNSVAAALLLLQSPRASATDRFVLSRTEMPTVISLGQTMVPLELSSAALTDLLTTSKDLSPVPLDTYVVGAEWTLGTWSAPLSKMMAQSSASDREVVIDVQLSDAMDVVVSQLLVLADNTPLNGVDVSLVFGNEALAGLTELVQIHVSGMKTTFEDAWLPRVMDLDQLIFDEVTVEKLEFETSVTIQQVAIRRSNLAFPTAVLALDTAVTVLILEHNIFAGPIELTKKEFALLSNISDFRATANIVDASDGGKKSCIDRKVIKGLTICIVKDEQSNATSSDTESNGNTSSSNAQANGFLETQSTTTFSTRNTSSTTAIVLVSVCAVVIVMALSFFRRFKKKASKFVDERRSYSNREDDLHVRESETGSELAVTGVAKVLADMDLGKDEVVLSKKLGVQNLWLGEYKDTKVVALKFVPRELDMSIKDLNAVRMSYVPLRHDNVVCFLGSSWTDREEALIVVEHMPKGSLRSVLADEKINLAWPQRLQMSKNICSGLDFVRSIEGVNLSRNLTAKSVLLDAQFICKMDIFDYASSLRTDLAPVRSFGNGDIASRAPELLKGDKITAAAEVYALGVIFCEISSRSKVFERITKERGATMADIFIATEVVAQRLSPSPAKDAPASFQELTLQCLCYEPSKRPKLSEILGMISK